MGISFSWRTLRSLDAQGVVTLAQGCADCGGNRGHRLCSPDANVLMVASMLLIFPFAPRAIMPCSVITGVKG